MPHAAAQRGIATPAPSRAAGADDAAALETAVAGHYDRLDELYRELWGEHLHHGLWITGDERPKNAVRTLAEVVAERAGVVAGERVCDVGCGYGGTTALLEAEHGARVTGLTISPVQHGRARARNPNAEILLRSWLDNGLPSESFDVVLAIESISHMADRRRAMSEAARVLRPGGRLVLCDWLAGPRRGRTAERLVLGPLARDAHLPELVPAATYVADLARAGLVVDAHDDLTSRVSRTWSVVGARVARRFATDPAFRRLLGPRGSPDRRFLVAAALLGAGYVTGTTAYGLFVAHRP